MRRIMVVSKFLPPPMASLAFGGLLAMGAFGTISQDCLEQIRCDLTKTAGQAWIMLLIGLGLCAVGLWQIWTVRRDAMPVYVEQSAPRAVRRVAAAETAAAPEPLLLDEEVAAITNARLGNLKSRIRPEAVSEVAVPERVVEVEAIELELQSAPERHPELVSGATVEPDSEAEGEAGERMLKQIQHDGESGEACDAHPDIPPIIDPTGWLPAQSPEVRHYIASRWNWRADLSLLKAIADQPDCDTGTAAQIFWVAGLARDFTTGAESSMANDQERIVLDMIHALAARFLNRDFHTDDFAFDDSLANDVVKANLGRAMATGPATFNLAMVPHRSYGREVALADFEAAKQAEIVAFEDWAGR
jgi:Domain of unknown function (DUF4274)